MERTRVNLGGRPTGIGSLPPMSQREAFAWVSDFSPEIPFVPQIPGNSAGLGMLHELFPDAGNFFNLYENRLDYRLKAGQESAFLEYLDDCRNINARVSVEQFCEELRTAGSMRAIKNQIAGPFALLLGLSANGRPLVELPGATVSIVRYLSRVIDLETEILAKVNLPILWMLDEPIVPDTGMGVPPTLLEELFDQLRELCFQVGRCGGLAGVHCCASIVKGAPFLEKIGASARLWSLPIVELTKAGKLEKQLGAAQTLLKDKLQSGGFLLAGIVPTDEAVQSIDRARAVETVLALLPSENDRLSRVAITPSCGLATLSINDTIEIAERTRLISAALHASAKK